MTLEGSVACETSIIGTDDFENVVFGRSFLNSSFAGLKSFFRFSKHNLYSYFSAGEIPVDYIQKANLRKYVLPSDLHRLNSSEADPGFQGVSAVTPFASLSQNGKSDNVVSFNFHGTSQLPLGSVLRSKTDAEVKLEKGIDGQVLEIDGGNSNIKRSSVLNKTSSKKQKNI